VTAQAPSTTPRRRRLRALWDLGRPAVMGILNCTPDSFSDGGDHALPDQALRRAQAMIAEGADLVDIGGESTRPGAGPVDAATEIQRVAPVVSALRRLHPDLPISVDTSKASVALAALERGADLVNDVTAASDPDMLGAVVEYEAAIALMHMRGTPRTMQSDTVYTHVVAEVHGFLADRAAAAVDAGLPDDAVWVDPGIGFGKDDADNLALLRSVPDLATMGHPVLVGASRKSFIGRLTGAPVADRLPGTLASLLPALSTPRTVVRVHDPGAVRQFLSIAIGLIGATP
jgi:dihydropteroate synthase